MELSENKSKKLVKCMILEVCKNVGRDVIKLLQFVPLTIFHDTNKNS